MPSSAVYSGVERFTDNDELTEVTFAEGVTTIGYDAFMGCSSLTAIIIPDGVTTIGDYAFYGCTALTRLSLSPAVSVGFFCFLDCTALISAAADQNMPTVEDLLHYRWHRNVAVLERVNALLCLKTLFTTPKKRKREDGGEAQTLGVTAVRKRLPKVMWRVILEFL
jgi:hypothetical protein